MVISIILIIFGAFSLLGGVASSFMGRLTASTLRLDDFALQYYQTVGMISLISGAVELICGIFGVRLRNNQDKAGTLLTVGIIYVIVTVFTTLYTNMLSAAGERVIAQIIEATGVMTDSTGINVNSLASSSNIVSMVIGFALPALFIVGALLNRLPPKNLYPHNA
jgi:hypothetical protein